MAATSPGRLSSWARVISPPWHTAFTPSPAPARGARLPWHPPPGEPPTVPASQLTARRNLRICPLSPAAGPTGPRLFTDLGHDHVRFVPVPATKSVIGQLYPLGKAASPRGKAARARRGAVFRSELAGPGQAAGPTGD